MQHKVAAAIWLHRIQRVKIYGFGLSKFLDYGLRPMGLDYGIWISWIKARNLEKDLKCGF